LKAKFYGYGDSTHLPTSTTSFLPRVTQRGVVLRHDRDDRSRIFRALAFVDGRGVGRQQRIEFAETVGDGAAVEVGNNLTVVSGGEGVSRISGPGSGWPSSDFGAS